MSLMCAVRLCACMRVCVCACVGVVRACAPVCWCACGSVRMCGVRVYDVRHCSEARRYHEMGRISRLKFLVRMCVCWYARPRIMRLPKRQEAAHEILQGGAAVPRNGRNLALEVLGAHGRVEVARQPLAKNAARERQRHSD